MFILFKPIFLIMSILRYVIYFGIRLVRGMFRCLYRRFDPFFPLPINLDKVPTAVFENSYSNYLTLKLYRDYSRDQFKYIVRGLMQPECWPDDDSMLDPEINGIDMVLMGQVMEELRPLNAVYDLVGFGKLYCDPREKTVTFYEEKMVVTDKFEGHSEQCYRAREIVDSGKFKPGYVTYHALKDCQLSPKSLAQRKGRPLRNPGTFLPGDDDPDYLQYI